MLERPVARSPLAGRVFFFFSHNLCFMFHFVRALTSVDTALTDCVAKYVGRILL